MSDSIRVINEILVEIFNDILNIEENELQSKECKDLSITEIHTIDAIGIGNQKSMSEIAEKLNITVGTLTTAINRLLKKGYVKRNRNEQDRRIVQIQLTDKGRYAYGVHERFHNEMIENMIKDLKLGEDQILLKSLEKLRDFLKIKYYLQK